MLKRIGCCSPKPVKTAPAGSEWIHEIKMVGYRGLLERDDDKVRLLSKSGLDWTWRDPLIVEAALKLRTKRFVLDGEIVILTETGDADFDALHGNRRNSEAQLYAFDLLALAGDDLREDTLAPLSPMCSLHKSSARVENAEAANQGKLLACRAASATI
ncbi:hypothetical protein [Bradyrhizobium sp. WSM1417]|uniref:ATP-dependent DNA ligase n=1 Tax=Bradyrhizobium sp. WSM1417 TaxID=754500 RepID=UPI0004B1F0D4|nr:hypothetical protein [Bradyrhizobium sp. WSM1417]